MKWPWPARAGEAGTAQSQTPIPWEPKVTVGTITYKQKYLADGRVYHGWTCNFCGTEIGSCFYGNTLRRAVYRHMNNCQTQPCGNDACIKCVPSPVVIE